MEKIYGKTPLLLDSPTPYCEGCYHGLIQKLCFEVVEEVDIADRFVYGGAVGCNGMGSFTINMDAYGTCHGRSPCVGTALKRLHPDSVLMIYQGDGDAASIGLGDTLHAANRGESFTVVMANNSLYGMTGGQSSPTTPPGMETTTTKGGKMGPPLRVAELVATLDTPYYVARCSVHSAKYILQFKKALKYALKAQIEQGAYSFIEVLANCPTSSGVKPMDSMKYMEDIAMKHFPVREFKRDGKHIKGEVD